MSRRVRVTLEGDAHGFPGSDVLRVFVGASQCVTVDPSWPHVSVEDVEPERVWTDGDVVQNVSTDRTVVRGTPLWTDRGDKIATRDVAAGYYRVLRYQHGEAERV